MTLSLTHKKLIWTINIQMASFVLDAQQKKVQITLNPIIGHNRGNCEFGWLQDNIPCVIILVIRWLDEPNNRDIMMQWPQGGEPIYGLRLALSWGGRKAGCLLDWSSFWYCAQNVRPIFDCNCIRLSIKSSDRMNNGPFWGLYCPVEFDAVTISRTILALEMDQ